MVVVVQQQQQVVVGAAKGAVGAGQLAVGKMLACMRHQLIHCGREEDHILQTRGLLPPGPPLNVGLRPGVVLALAVLTWMRTSWPETRGIASRGSRPRRGHQRGP